MFDAEEVFVKQRWTAEGLWEFPVDLFFVIFELISNKRKQENKDNYVFLVQLELMVTRCILCCLVDLKKQ